MKRRGRHTTIIEGLEPILRQLERLDGVEVSPGRISTGLPTGHHILKVKQLSGGSGGGFSRDADEASTAYLW